MTIKGTLSSKLWGWVNVYFDQLYNYSDLLMKCMYHSCKKCAFWMVKDGKCVNGVYANTCSARNLLQKMHENVCVIYACKCSFLGHNHETFDIFLCLMNPSWSCVGHFMYLQIFILGECLVRCVAGKGILFCVGHFMSLKLVLVGCQGISVAGKCLLSCVGRFMYLQTVILGEYLVTCETGKCLFLCVGRFMSLQTCTVGCLFKSAGKCLLSCVGHSCIFKLLYWGNILSHVKQANVFSSVWAISCLSKPVLWDA